jgi:iron(III) transport system ATP-binding protein
MQVDLNDSKFLLRSTGEVISSDVCASKVGSFVGAVRPEDLEILPSSAQPEDDKTKFEVPVVIQEVSYIGREIEVYGQTTNGEVIKAIGRPDAELITLAPLDKVVFRTQKEKVLFFVDENFGVRI